MKTVAASGVSALVGALIGVGTTDPLVSLDLNTLIYLFLTLVTALVGAGFIATRRSKRLQEAEARKTEADAEKSQGDAVLTHAQYEGFIAEAAQRLQVMQEATLARMEKELAQSRQKIAELEAELERAKRERNEALGEARDRERELREEIDTLQTRVADLERRLEAAGVEVTPGRRHGDKTRRSTKANPD